jgi:hypothetical protein
MLTVQVKMFECWELDWKNEFRTCVNGYSISLKK